MWLRTEVWYGQRLAQTGVDLNFAAIQGNVVESLRIGKLESDDNLANKVSKSTQHCTISRKTRTYCTVRVSPAARVTSEGIVTLGVISTGTNSENSTNLASTANQVSKPAPSWTPYV